MSPTPVVCALCGKTPSEVEETHAPTGIRAEFRLLHQCPGEPFGLICSPEEWATHNAVTGAAIEARVQEGYCRGGDEASEKWRVIRSEATAPLVEVLRHLYNNVLLELGSMQTAAKLSDLRVWRAFVLDRALAPYTPKEPEPLFEAMNLPEVPDFPDTITLPEAKDLRTRKNRRTYGTEVGDLICTTCGGSQKKGATDCFSCGSFMLKTVVPRKKKAPKEDQA